MERKITIVVPTRERADTLLYCLQTLVAQNYDRLEILVSDNCSADNTLDVVKSFNDPRIRYVKTPLRADMSSNWEFAFDHVEDGYVGFLGDDDGYLPGALGIANAILEETGQTSISWQSGIYNWPGTENENSLILPLGRDFYIASSKALLKKFRRNNFGIRNLLSLYPNGIVEVKKIKELKSRFGKFFTLTNQPDIFSTIVLTSELKTFAYANAPLSLIGISKKSNAGSAYESSAVINQYRTEYREYSFHPRLELFQFTPLAIAEGYFRALDALNTPISNSHAKTYLQPMLVDMVQFIPTLNSRELQQKGFEAVRKIAGKNAIGTQFVDAAVALFNSTPTLTNHAAPQKSQASFGARWQELQVDTTKFALSTISDACAFAGNTLSFNEATRLNFFKSSFASEALNLARFGRRFAEKLLLKK